MVKISPKNLDNVAANEGAREAHLSVSSAVTFCSQNQCSLGQDTHLLLELARDVLAARRPAELTQLWRCCTGTSDAVCFGQELAITYSPTWGPEPVVAPPPPPVDSTVALQGLDQIIVYDPTPPLAVYDPLVDNCVAGADRMLLVSKPLPAPSRPHVSLCWLERLIGLLVTGLGRAPHPWRRDVPNRTALAAE